MPAQQPGTTNPSLLTGEPLSAHRAALHSRRADLQYRQHPSTMVGAAVRPHCQLGEDRSNRVTQRGKMADCSLTDEDFSSFVFNYLTENAESQVRRLPLLDSAACLATPPSAGRAGGWQRFSMQMPGAGAGASWTVHCRSLESHVHVV